MSKTVSSRIPKDLHDKLKEKCNEEGCNTNDFIRDMLEIELEQEPKEESKTNNEPQKIFINDMPDEKPKEPQKITMSDVPQATVRLIPQDNSNKPPIEMILFNGRYIPKAEVYEI